jgi:shikimate kinase
VRDKDPLAATKRSVVLIGLMGVGKTTVGRLLAARLHWSVWDNDEALEAAIGKTAAQLQLERGQHALHKTEDRLLREALRTQAPTVFAAASSVVLNPALLTGVITVWLRMSTATEERNIARSGQRHRPLPVDAAAALARMSADRLALYGSVADVVVDVGDDPASTCERVLGAVRGFSEAT